MDNKVIRVVDKIRENTKNYVYNSKIVPQLYKDKLYKYIFKDHELDDEYNEIISDLNILLIKLEEKLNEKYNNNID